MDNISSNFLWIKRNKSENSILLFINFWNSNHFYVIYIILTYVLFNLKNDQGKIEDVKSMVSGGEKQRVSVARIFLKDPKILLLDEPTSALDKKNEILITNSLDMLMKGRTTFIVTHRLDSIKNADVILVFDNGRLVQKGTHDELIKVKGQYKFLFSLN